jgi:hypothetical protein
VDKGSLGGVEVESPPLSRVPGYFRCRPHRFGWRFRPVYGGTAPGKWAAPEPGGMDGRTVVGGLLTASGGLFAYVAVTTLFRNAGSAGTASLVALGGLALIALTLATLGGSLLVRSRRVAAGDD